MPFTISHTAAAIPFRRTKLIMSALVIGCMAPDFEYFIHAGMYGREAHNLRGALSFALPATLIVLVVFHTLLKRPIVALLPSSVQERIVLEEFRLWPLNRLLLVVLSGLIGIATHLAWDSFTHVDGIVVEHFGWFNERTAVLGRMVSNYKIAQHGSTLVGLALLALWFLHWYRTEPRHAMPVYTLAPSAKFFSVLGMLVVAALLAMLRAHQIAGPVRFGGAFIGNSIVAFVSILCLELLLFAIAMRSRIEKRREAV